MFTIKTNKNCLNEKKYVFDFIFCEVLNIEYKVELHEELNVQIIFESKKIIINEFFFDAVKEKWLENINLIPNISNYLDIHKFPIKINILHPSIPIIFGNDKIKFINNNEIDIGLDIFGSIFYLLTGYEESQNVRRDIHNRFVCKNSFLYNDNLILRPIVNEYIEFLFSLIKYLNTNFKLPDRKFEKNITSDVDLPYNFDFKSIRGLIAGTLKYLFKKDYTDSPLKLIKNYFYFKLNKNIDDQEYNNFKWMLKKFNGKKNKLIFFFLFNKNKHKLDGNYLIDEQPIKKLIDEIDKCGHDVGVHFSYDTYKNYNKIKDELTEFNSSSDLREKKSRQHYLRWCSISTPKLLYEAGIENDFTVGFSDHVGFRSGTCYKYKLYDLVSREILNIYETPLLVMDVSLYSEKYMNMSSLNQIIDLLDQLIKECKHYNGIFSAVWHNNQLNQKDHRFIFEHLID
tara:strand:- start:92 stop:1459 length:1368 start_codon:yes stop_codon:yes gene_type:complete